MITVFYANKVYGQFNSWMHFRDIYKEGYISDEVWQGCFYCSSTGKGWWRSDRTPVLDEDVPPALKSWLLLLEE